MANLPADAGKEAIRKKGWLKASRWLVLRRLTQLTIILLFLAGPWFGYWIVKGNLASSLTLDVMPLTDPYVLLQSLIAGHELEQVSLIGAVIVIVFYIVVGGRVYCSWVCPVNLVTDAADWFRRVFNIKGGARFSTGARYWILVMTLLLALMTATITWELVNPVSIVFRGIVFGSGFAIVVIMSIFLFDLLISRKGWCGHLCPVGAFYSLLGKLSIFRISAVNREQCDDCMDCFMVCPEEQVIKPALKGKDKGTGPVIMDMNCTNCGRCIDVCAKNVFTFSTRFNNSMHKGVAYNKKEVAP